MNSSDRAQFDEQMALLCAGYNVPVSVRPDAYWKGMAKMSIIEFARCIERALSEDGPEKIPTTRDLWNIRRDLRRVGREPQAAPAAPAQIAHSRGLMRVNQLFLRFLYRRRVIDGFRGDLGIVELREACISLARWLDESIAEGLEPEEQELQRIFAADMARTLSSL